MSLDSPVVHVYLLCWNEALLLPHCLQHYSFASNIFLWDNQSSDQSLSIASQYPNVSVHSYDSGQSFNEQIQVELKNTIWKQSRPRADFVIVCDCDEFLYHPDLPEALAELKSRRVSLLKPRGYDMISSNRPDASCSILQQVNHGVRNYKYDKCILFDPNQLSDINFGMGSHICNPVGQLHYYRTPDWKLLHFKYLSADYLIQRYQSYHLRLSPFNLKYKLSQSYQASPDSLLLEFQQVQSRAEYICLQEKKQLYSEADIQQCFEMSLQAMQNKQYDRCQQLLDEILQYKADHVAALANMASLLQRKQLFSDAQFALQQALAIDAERFDLWNNLGNLHLRQQHYAVARICYREVLRLQPSFSPAQTQLAVCEEYLKYKPKAVSL